MSSSFERAIYIFRCAVGCLLSYWSCDSSIVTDSFDSPDTVLVSPIQHNKRCGCHQLRQVAGRAGILMMQDADFGQCRDKCSIQAGVRLGEGNGEEGCSTLTLPIAAPLRPCEGSRIWYGYLPASGDRWSMMLSLSLWWQGFDASSSLPSFIGK